MLEHHTSPESWDHYALELGMPLLAPGQVAEVELLKWLGAFQWSSIARRVGVPSAALVNRDGERLYASFATLDLVLPPERGLASFDEGNSLRVLSHVIPFANRFVEGLHLFDTPDRLTAVPSDLLEHPYVRFTNSFVARDGNNTRLKVQEPAGLADRPGPTLRSLPAALVEHMEVQERGLVGPVETDAIPVGSELEHTYAVVPETDLNGAGLLYFARYITMMDVATRRWFAERLPVPVSDPLLRTLTTTRRRVFYFANADGHDTVRVRIRGSRVPCEMVGAPGRRVAAGFRFDMDLYRASDRVLLASAAAWRRLELPEGDKALRAEAGRLLTRLSA